MSINITQEQAEALLWEYEDDVTTPEDDFVVLNKTNWHGQSKYLYCNVYFQLKGHEEIYQLKINKTGSHFDDWHYEYDLTCPQVCKKTKTVISYENCE